MATIASLYVPTEPKPKIKNWKIKLFSAVFRPKIYDRVTSQDSANKNSMSHRDQLAESEYNWLNA